MDPALPSRTADLLAEMPRIAVIKEVREATGFSLAEAKAFCAAAEARRYLRESVPPEFGGGSLAARVRLLQSAGDGPGAVRVVLDETGMTGEEAEGFVAYLLRSAG